MKIRHLIATAALLGFSASAIALDSTEDRLMSYALMAKPLEATTIVDTREVSYGHVGMDKAAELGLATPRTELHYTGSFEPQMAEELTGTQQRLADIGFRAPDLTYRSTRSGDLSDEIAGRIPR